MLNETNKRSNQGPSLQDMILQLNEYWAARGCVLWLPSNTEVGAGTMNSATFLRVLGPENWNVAYTEPSVRPDDSRYGENPNRIQQHLQYQVVLKPDPGTPQELYLGSLEALGIDRGKHDIRFVEDNWESPALGAWGLGWEVWLDGQEITQFTYFQQAGGVALDPVAVEITYGLERIALPLQQVRHFKDIRYSPTLTYGELLGQNEYEMSVYNLEAADPSRLGQIFSLFELEAKKLLSAGLVLPGYSYVLKCSHVFNLLDARGTVGVTERASYFARMRDLAHDAARLWLVKREEQGFPLKTAGVNGEVPAVGRTASSGAAVGAPRTFVLEIGTEELPAADLNSALQQLKDRIAPWFAERRLTHGDITVEGTPRRLAVIVHDLQPRQADEMRIAKGPAERVAFDALGQPTQAAVGFARSQGVDVRTLRVEDIEGGRYVVASLSARGRSTLDVLSEGLPGLIASLQFPSSMRWNASNVAFSRPLRWLVALFGKYVVPFEYAGVRSGRRSRGLRSDGSPDLDVASAETYSQLMESSAIILDRNSRESAIRSGGGALAAAVGGTLTEDDSLLSEVTNLVEAPTPLLGTYEAQFLSMPREVLVTVMRKHQRYFPVESETSPGRLLPYFVAVANGNIDEEVVRRGNEDVLAARYADASFFWKHDRSQPLEAWRQRLAGLTFQSKLGSMLDKSNRVERLTPSIAALLRIPNDQFELATRIAHLAKADLVTQMVIEFTNLQGVMGREYASHSGEPRAVAQGIFEHYLPRFAGDALPESPAAIAVGISDRLDSLVGLFSVGLAPRAVSDPFASRRAALGLVQILAERQLDLDLHRAIAEVAAVQPVEVTAQAQEEVLLFIRRRFEQWLLERGSRPDVVRAVLTERGTNPALVYASVQELGRLVDTDRFQRALKAYARAARLVRGKAVLSDVAPELFESDSERRLWTAVCQVARSVKAKSSVSEFLDAFESVIQPIDAFFESVFVMAEQEEVRANRHALLKHVSDLPQGIVDLSQIHGF